MSDDPRALIACCDGTGQGRNANRKSNIAKIMDILDQQKHTFTESGLKRTRNYFEGIGVHNRLEQITASTLDWHVKELYIWLSRSYRPNSEVYLFGFSRGSFIVRSVVGMIAQFGLLRFSSVDDESELKAKAESTFNMYQNNNRYSWNRAGEDDHYYKANIMFVGLFDTVSGLREDTEKLHDIYFPGKEDIIRASVHLMAPSVTKFFQNISFHCKNNNRGINKCKECRDGDHQEYWLEGDHCDVGGGWYENPYEASLSNRALKIMIDHCKALGVTMPAEYLLNSDDGSLLPTHSVLNWDHMHSNSEELLKYNAYKIIENNGSLKLHVLSTCDNKTCALAGLKFSFGQFAITYSSSQNNEKMPSAAGHASSHASDAPKSNWSIPPNTNTTLSLLSSANSLDSFKTLLNALSDTDILHLIGNPDFAAAEWKSFWAFCSCFAFDEVSFTEEYTFVGAFFSLILQRTRTYATSRRLYFESNESILDDSQQLFYTICHNEELESKDTYETLGDQIGACIAVKDESSGGESKRWFPLCGQRKADFGRECLVMEKGVWVSFRKVVRLFRLSDPDHQIFPPGYFINLFLKILSLFEVDSANVVKVFINGMDVKYQFKDSKLQIMVVVLDDCSFTLELSFASRIACSPNSGEFWERFKKICEVILSPRELSAANESTRVSPWFDNVKLTEMFVNPTHAEHTRVQQGVRGGALKVEEFRKTMSPDDLKECSESIQNLYIYGCDETDMPVDEKDPPRHILESIWYKVDKIQQQLTERWNTVTVTVSSDLIQQSFNAMMKSLQDSASTELHSIVEASRQSICESTVTMDHLQSIVDKLRGDINEKITDENTQVLTELNRVQESMKELTTEVQNIQTLDDKTLQTAILKAVDDSKALMRLGNMMQTVVKGTYDVPTMAIVIPVMKKFTINPSDWTSNEYSLFFICSHTHQVVPCGPDNKGYKFRRAKDWFKKVAPVIKVCLIAAKIALTISGIPLPINGVVETMDQITKTTESVQYLNSAMSIVDAVDSTASELGIAIGDQGTGVDDLSTDNAEQYVKSLDDLLKQSDTVEAYKSLKALIDEVDSTMGSVGVEKVTSNSGKTGWVKKGDQAVIDSFIGDETWPIQSDELKKSYKEAATVPETQSRLGERIGLWLPKSWLGKKTK